MMLLLLGLYSSSLSIRPRLWQLLFFDQPIMEVIPDRSNKLERRYDSSALVGDIRHNWAFMPCRFLTLSKVPRSLVE
jgi:hypothetical protein